MAYGELSIQNIMRYDCVVMKIYNSREYNSPNPTIRLTALNTFISSAAPLVCTCTAFEHRIDYLSLPQVARVTNDKDLTDQLMEKLGQLIKQVPVA